jgi:hypothetical protein
MTINKYFAAYNLKYIGYKKKHIGSYTKLQWNVAIARNFAPVVCRFKK